jgi:hypothetical protein
MLGDAVGDAVEGQFVMDVGAEGHKITLLKGF